MSLLTKRDFETDQEVRWCPGCGDYAILASMQKILPTLPFKQEDHVFVSGIGCSSRFPYYVNAYGFHTIHGRAPTIATGLSLTRPELKVWVITGDGDALSIGANHLVHLMRRNVNVTVLLFNNQIYGLTKGQYSPTSEQGKVTKSSPSGSPDAPLSPVALALASNCSFVARAIDVDAVGLQAVLSAAALHQGCALVEIYQNCNVFNDGAFSQFADRTVRHSQTVTLNHGQPIVFGEDRGLRYADATWSIVSAKDASLHDAVSQKHLAQALIDLPNPDFPVPLGIIRQTVRPILSMQTVESTEKKSFSDLMSTEGAWKI